MEEGLRGEGRTGSNAMDTGTEQVPLKGWLEGLGWPVAAARSESETDRGSLDPSPRPTVSSFFCCSLSAKAYTVPSKVMGRVDCTSTCKRAALADCSVTAVRTRGAVRGG